MKFITLHNDMNPNQDVFIDSDSIVSIVPYGSGSVINGDIAVHETPVEVEILREGV